METEIYESNTIYFGWEIQERLREERNYNNTRPHRSLANQSPAKYQGGGHCVPDQDRLVNSLIYWTRIRKTLGCSRTNTGSGTMTGGGSLKVSLCHSLQRIGLARFRNYEQQVGGTTGVYVRACLPYP
jgi:hypothetical protein